MNSIYIKTYYGLGDNLFMYPFIKEASKRYETVYLETYFPFIYYALPNIKFVKPRQDITLLTCKDSLNNQRNIVYVNKPEEVRELRFPYYLNEFKKGRNLVQSFNRAISINNQIDYTLPLNPNWIKKAKEIIKNINTDKKLCLLKIPTDRKDWKCPARLPKIEYYQHLIDKYKEQYYFISVGNNNYDTGTDNLFGIDLHFDNGELDITTIFALVASVDLIICHNCFLFPLGVVTKTKTFVINGGYTDPNFYIDRAKTDLNHIEIVTPQPNCNCINRFHDCNKNIDIEILDKKFEDLLSGNINNKIIYSTIPLIKQNLLISRMRVERCYKIANNSSIKDKFNIFTIDHTSVDKYREYGNLFNKSYQFHSVGNICRPQVDDSLQRKLYWQCANIIKENNIDIVINSQPLHPYNTIMNQVCKDMKIKVINTETTFDDKWLFDYKSCQYMNNNEIYDYVYKINVPLNAQIDYPKSSRQEQPNNISKDKLFDKYNLNPLGKYIVLFGQLLWDMSIIQSTNQYIHNYYDYIDLLLKWNPNVIFLVKPHPLYFKYNKMNEMNFLNKYKNVIIINESLSTLFNAFDYFTSFSSTVIIEGLIRNKKFATMGFHYCNNDNLVIQLRTNSSVKNLYDKLSKFKISQQDKLRYLYFIFNYYTIDLSSPKLADRLLLTSEEYFSKLY